MMRGLPAGAPISKGVALIVLLLAFGLRLLRLSWQPLWWDEGYSIYFATEPLVRMLWLTANDIHPPLFYVLLKGWFTLLGSTSPEVARIFSSLLAMPAVALSGLLAKQLMRRSPVAPLLLMVLLAINPFHIYYSQEVRMYGLTVTLIVLSTYLLWRWMQAEPATAGTKWYGIAYVLCAIAALHTLYYAAFVLIAQWFFGIVFYYQHLRGRRLFWGILSIAIAAIPWLAYATPVLVEYVSDKVASDQDVSLSLSHYLFRHLTAFFSGHLKSSRGALSGFWLLGPLAIVLLAGATLYARVGSTLDRSGHRPKRPTFPTMLLVTLVIFPASIAFIINVIWPFFPEGGERLLLMLLPFVLLLTVQGLVNSAASLRLRLLSGLLLVIAAAGGTALYYTKARYSDHDYRPLIAQVIQQGKAADTVVALFPWQVGYWRAYAPRDNTGHLLSPQPARVDQQALEWNQDLASSLEEGLTSGVLWFPAPLSFGSALPEQVEQYLDRVASNLVNKWYGPATRLTAWARTPIEPGIPQTLPFKNYTFALSVLGPHTVASANEPIHLAARIPSAMLDENPTLNIRIADGEERAWTSRSINLRDEVGPSETNDSNFIEHHFGHLVPPGLPPGLYMMEAALSTQIPRISPSPVQNATETTGYQTIGPLTVTNPAIPLSPIRLPIDKPVTDVRPHGGVQLLGFAGVDTDSTVMAGTQVPLTLFQQAVAPEPWLVEIEIGLRNQAGQVTTQWRGWPLPAYPPSVWTVGTLVRLPVPFYLPPELVPGTHGLYARSIDGIGDASDWIELTRFSIYQRTPQVVEAQPTHELPAIAQFGTHARLVGYDSEVRASRVHLRLYWEILAPLLPPHHIFVHVRRADLLIGQADGPPQTTTGVAPSGTWRTGESLRTDHDVNITGRPDSPVSNLELQIGLYEPISEVRLPVFVDGEPHGDHVTITVQQERE